MKYIYAFIYLLLALLEKNIYCIEGENSNIKLKMAQGHFLENKIQPFIVNILSPDTKTKNSNVDIICVIDVSGSMEGEKIKNVKESLKLLVDTMEESDRLSLVIFNTKAMKLLGLESMIKPHKEIFYNTIDSIEVGGGTNILSGLGLAIEIFKEQQKMSQFMEKSKTAGKYKERVSSIILLSDGNDNNLNEIELAKGMRDFTKGALLYFTLHTFGYGVDHDPKVMNKLANLRDGSFYYVEDLKKLKEYFINVLGGCMSVISKQVELKIKSIDNKCQINKVYGTGNLFYFSFNSDHFTTEMLQFISGKEYTYVMEISCIDDVKLNDDIFSVSFSYNNLTNENEKVTMEQVYKYQDTEKGDANLKEVLDADEEYAHSFVYETISDVVKMQEANNPENAKQKLIDMQSWLQSSYRGKKKSDYMSECMKCYKLCENDNYMAGGRNVLYQRASEEQTKRGGSNLAYSNSLQKMLMKRA